MQWVVKSIKLHQDEQILSFGKLAGPGEVGRLILMTGSHRNSSTLSSQKRKEKEKEKRKIRRIISPILVQRGRRKRSDTM